MDNTPKWLSEYYGPEADLLNPAIMVEGEKWAIIRLTKTTRVSNHSNIGYVLIQKAGRHVATPHISLHEGVASDADLLKMKGVLKKYEEQ